MYQASICFVDDTVAPACDSPLFATQEPSAVAVLRAHTVAQALVERVVPRLQTHRQSVADELAVRQRQHRPQRHLPAHVIVLSPNTPQNLQDPCS